MNNRNMVIGIVVVVVVLILGGAWYFNSGKSSQEAPATSSDLSSPASSPATSEATPGDISASDSAIGESVKEFVVTGSSFKFDPATMTVNTGDRVKITFKSAGGIHDLVIDEFNVKTKELSSGGTETVEFTADKAGTYKYYCNVGNHRQMGMEGTLTVQ